MANNETLGASFSIDVTELKSGLAQANRLIRESESEFKAAAAGMDKWTDSQEGLEARIKHLNTATDLQRKKVDALQDEYDRLIADGLDPASREAVELRTKINKETEALNKNEKELENQRKALEELGEETEDVSEKTEDASDGFTVMKGAAANLVAEGITRLVDGCKTAITTLLGLSEETREYREDIGKLQTAFEAAGKSTDLATGVYKEFYSILGEEDRSVEAVNHLAKFVETEKDMARWTDIAAGVWGTFGDSLPIEGLTEASNETAKVGQLTGVLADALNWAGVNEDKFQESLDNCNTEQERAQLITDTLNGLYSEAAGLYRENNESVIAARKATSEYTDTMAELGEEMEPVNADITELKTEFAKEFVPVLKKQVAPAIKDFVKSLKDSGAAKKLGQVIGFVAENFETLATVTLTAVTVYKTFSAAMKVATAITATKTAVAALSTGVGVATKMQVGWNAAMAANPIGAVLTAVALLTTGIVLLAGSMGDASTKTDYLNQRQREAVTAAQEAAEAYRETRDAANEMAAAGNAQIDYTKILWGELKTLADASGKVKDSDKARADFIIGELNNALGTEYSMTGNIINNYNSMVSSIEKVIEAKRAQILLEAYEESYATAVKNVAEAEKARAIQAQELITYEENLEAAQIKAKEARAKYEEALDSGVTGRKLQSLRAQASGFEGAVNIEKQKLEEKRAEYLETDTTLKGYYDNINSYETASTLILEGETNKAIGYLNKYGSGFQTAASVAKKSKDEQLEILREQVIDTEIHLGTLEAEYKAAQGNMTEEEKAQAKLRIENAKKQAKDAKDEYYKVGGNMVEGMAKGAEDGEWTLTGSLKKTVSAG